MKNSSKKAIAGLVTGAFLLVGIAVPMGVQAAAENYPSAFHQKQAQKTMNSQRLSETFGVSEEEVTRYSSQGYNYKALGHAAFLAKASGKSLSEVMILKTADNSWKDVAQALSVTPEQRLATRNDLAAAHLERRWQISRETSNRLLASGHSARDIAAANLLAQKTGKSLDEIITLHKPDTRWEVTAAVLGIDPDAWRQEMKQMRQDFKGGHPANPGSSH